MHKVLNSQQEALLKPWFASMVSPGVCTEATSPTENERRMAERWERGVANSWPKQQEKWSASDVLQNPAEPLAELTQPLGRNSLGKCLLETSKKSCLGSMRKSGGKCQNDLVTGCVTLRKLLNPLQPWFHGQQLSHNHRAYLWINLLV